MVEVDVVLRGGDRDPILAHPPDTDSDITLQEWLAQMGSTNKGIKLDFKRYLSTKIVVLFAFLPVTILQLVVDQTPPYCAGQSGDGSGRWVRPARRGGCQCLDRPVWLNGDILPGPCGSCAPLDARAFLGAVTSSCPDATLSLGWTGACHRGQGYEWPVVQEMWRLCQALSQPVTFAVRAALVPSSLPQLQWLAFSGHRYSLTVWTGKADLYSVEDLLLIRENFDKSRVYYDIFEPQNSEFKKAIGIE
ncbi:protein FAM151B [Geospiza fortis]|uniref:Protein FAM151B n=1 Tax=Geospiza fortis TaxID=48883 RepID=A0A8N5I1J7_GEOFO|nr:protein FAM151B [Geospiza fortis]